MKPTLVPIPGTGVEETIVVLSKLWRQISDRFLAVFVEGHVSFPEYFGLEFKGGFASQMKP